MTTIKRKCLQNLITFLSLMTLTGKKETSNKTPALTKSANIDIWEVGT